MSAGGKGSVARPFGVSADVFTENYCRTFGHKVRNGRCINCGAKPEGSQTEEAALQSAGQNNGVQEGTIG